MRKRKPKSPATLADILAPHTPEVRALVERLQTLIRESAPDATETANRGWHSLSYHDPKRGYFCGIFPRQADVVLVFEFGVLLTDPAGMLEGAGSQVRQVVVRHAKDIRVRPLKKLIRAALDLLESREVKVAMVKAAARPVVEKRR